MVNDFLEEMKALKEGGQKSETHKKYHLKKKAYESETKSNEPRIKQKENKAVFVTASHFNEELGLLALVLIDKEIKIYYIR